jgi:hypothetical protein
MVCTYIYRSTCNVDLLPGCIPHYTSQYWREYHIKCLHLLQPAFSLFPPKLQWTISSNILLPYMVPFNFSLNRTVLRMYALLLHEISEFAFLLASLRPPLRSSGQSSWPHNGDVLCFLWVTNWIYICYVEESRPPLWSSGQSSWPHNWDVLCFLWGTNWIFMLCRTKKTASVV